VTAFSEILEKSPAPIEVRADVPLQKLNTWRVGGAAALFAEPKDEADLHALLLWAHRHHLPVGILGWGSNVWIPDEGFSGLLIRLKGFEDEFRVDGAAQPQVICGAGVGTTRLLREAASQGWTRFERLAGIPGSVGGMIVMNAGTHLGEMAELVEWVDVIRYTAVGVRKLRLFPLAKDWHYRGNTFLRSTDIVVRAGLKIVSGDAAKVQNTIRDLLTRRKSTQPVDEPSAGSTFRNPAGHKAWQLISDAGMRGFQIGGAQVSEVHSNFIVNLGQAKAADVMAVIEAVESKVHEKFGIQLQREVRTIRRIECATGFVDLTTIPGVRIDLKYASADNVTGKNFYGDQVRALLHPIAAEKLARAMQFLRSERPDHGLLIYDALRPRSAQWELWAVVEGTPNEIYVANPLKGSIHNFGFAVDLTIVDGKGRPLDMGSGFDEFSKLSEPRCEKEFIANGQLSFIHIQNRELIRRVMTAAGFRGIETEWWHFDALPRDQVIGTFTAVE